MKEKDFSFERILNSAKARTAVVAIGVLGALPAAELTVAQPAMADTNPATASRQAENSSNNSENKDNSGVITLIVALSAVAAIGLAGLGGGNRRY